MAEQVRITVPFTRRKASGIVFWIFYTLFAPWYLLCLSIRFRSRAILVFSPYESLLAKPASLFSWTPIYLFLDRVPWQSETRCRKGSITRFIAHLFDCLGICCAKKVLLPTNFEREEVASQFFILPKKTESFPCVPDSQESSNEFDSLENDKKDRDSRKFQNRKKLAQTFMFPEKNTIISSVDRLLSHSNVEPLLRALSALDRENISLVIFGSGPELTAAKSVTVGLGLYNQVVFADYSELLLEQIAASDIFLIPALRSEAMEALRTALQKQTAVLCVDSPLSREVLFHDELLYESGNVQLLAERLEELSRNKETLRGLEKLSYQRGKLCFPDWAGYIERSFA